VIVVDSCGWVEFLANGPLAGEYAPYFEKPGEIITPAIVVYEVAKKVWREEGKERTFLIVAHMQQTRIIPFDAHLALAAADVSLHRGLPLADAIVYATGKEFGCEVVTSDGHFQGLPGVIFIPKNS
jgi:predicted nucleic acid-binding protein